MVEPAQPTILALNGGSSSLKFALFSAHECQRRLHGKIERIGLPGTVLTLAAGDQGKPTSEALATGDFATAGQFLINWLDQRRVLESVIAVGHRVVHGMHRNAPERIGPGLLDELRTLVAYDPEHLPAQIQLMELTLRRLQQVPQVACFDTAFHHTMPRVAKLLPLPRRFEAQGVQRYGFHGLSYAYLMRKLAELGEPAAKQGRVILAHLGNGASLAAVRDGASVDTTMGFTPAAGIPMSTRSGDIDPGILGFLTATQQLQPEQVQHLLTHEAGLLGVSQTSSDLRDLLKQEGSDVRAAEAVALFCQEVRKRIGAFAAVLGGVDLLVFSAGIGENSPVIRERICTDLGFLGVQLAPALNEVNAAVISDPSGRVTVRVLPTDEEYMIALGAREVLPVGH